MPSEPIRAPREWLPLLALCSLILVLLFLGGAAKVVIVSVLLSYILSPLVAAVESRGVNRGIATLVVLGTIVGFLAIARYRGVLGATR
jgi:predicted PurR-regulated permease PerM